jgi:hypothetical protein
VFRNIRTRWGNSAEVTRFTLAHELCHLLLDREYADELAIASGPWAPLAIERRANAFAAAFLMPTWLLRDALASTSAPADDPDTIKSVSARLHVSASSLIDRLYNLGEITFDDGCGSSGVSWLRCENEAVAVFRVVDAFVLAAEMEAPLCSRTDYVRCRGDRGLMGGFEVAGVA